MTKATGITISLPLLDLNPEPEDNREIIKIGQDSSHSIEIRHSRVKEENKPSAQNGLAKPKGGKRIKLLTQHKKEIAACNKINTYIAFKRDCRDRKEDTIKNCTQCRD